VVLRFGDCEFLYISIFSRSCIAFTTVYFSLSTRTERLRRLLDTLSQLDFGEYLIVQEADQLRVLRKDYFNEVNEEVVGAMEERTGPVYSASTLPKTVFPFQLVRNPVVAENWSGVDYHLPLQWQRVRGRIPGSYPPKPLHFHDKPLRDSSSSSISSRQKPHSAANGPVSNSKKRKMRRSKINGGQGGQWKAPAVINGSGGGVGTTWGGRALVSYETGGIFDDYSAAAVGVGAPKTESGQLKKPSTTSGAFKKRKKAQRKTLPQLQQEPTSIISSEQPGGAEQAKKEEYAEDEWDRMMQ